MNLQIADDNSHPPQLPRQQLAVDPKMIQKQKQEIQELKERLDKKDAQMLKMLAFIIVIASICVAAVLFKLNSCSLEVKELTKTTGECGKKQLEELEKCRNDLYDLREMKGKCIVEEQMIKGNSSLALVKNVEFLMQEMQDYKTQAAANADKRDSCEKHLRHVEDTMRQLMHNITVVVAENEKCQVFKKKYADELEDIKTKTTPSSHKD